MATTSIDRSKYDVAWISRTQLEYDVAVSMLDKVHGIMPAPDERDADRGMCLNSSTYHLGEMAGHNVVITSLHFWPDNILAPLCLARALRELFPKIIVSIMVTTGSGIPGIAMPEKGGHCYPLDDEDKHHDVRLGDVVVSRPIGLHGGVADADTFIQYPDGVRVFPRHVNAISREAKRTVLGMRVMHASRRKKTLFAEYLAELQQHDSNCRFPSAARDLLFEPEYGHQGGEHYGDGCHKCDASKAVQRPARAQATVPQIHFGTIASRTDPDIDVATRKGIKHDTGALAVQVGAAMMMDEIAPLVVTGIADYADSHQNEHWQTYAAATAAACGKALVSNVPVYD